MRIDVSKVAVSDNIMCNDRKDWRYVVGYQTDEKAIILLFIKTLKRYKKIF